MMYEVYNNILCVKPNQMIELGIVTNSYYKQLIHRQFFNKIRTGGNGREALIAFPTSKPEINEKIIQIAGDPKEVAAVSILEGYLTNDINAATFFRTVRKPNGLRLDDQKQLEYSTNAKILNAIDTIVIAKATKTRKITGNKTRLWINISNAVNLLPSKEYPHSMPGNHRSLQRVYKKYKEFGYESLVHGGIGNDNSRKIEGDIAEWILAYYCLPNKPLITMLHAEYEVIRIAKDWPSLTPQAIELFLDQPHIERIWTLARHGKDAFSNKFGHKLSRDRSEWFPNAYWAIDGTKLDWVHYYDNTAKMAAKLKINPVFDVYSEMIIGYSISETESHVDHFVALKAAMNFAQSKPYKLTYDNQSGHKSARMQNLYDGIVAQDGGVHNPTRPRAKSNPAEQIFNRLQQQVISTFWFSDKQSVKSKNPDNQPNIDFILSNKENLMSRDQLEKAWELAVKKWNNAKHPHLNQTRAEAYQNEQTYSESIDFMEMLDLFWVEETKPITYKGDGLVLRIGDNKYMFEVYDVDNKIDLNFRKYNIGKKFIVRYDPEQLDVCVQLVECDLNGNKTTVAHAQPKRNHQEIPVLMKEGDKEAWAEDFKVRDTELAEVEAELEALRRRTGITPDKLMEDQELMIKIGGDLTKEDRNDVESDSVFTYL